jgi:hypothetical protein
MIIAMRVFVHLARTKNAMITTRVPMILAIMNLDIA